MDKLSEAVPMIEPASSGTASNHQENNTSTSAENQASADKTVYARQTAFLLSWLKTHGKISTMEARRMGVNHVAGRINDLRNNGLYIQTHWTAQLMLHGLESGVRSAQGGAECPLHKR